MSLGLAVRGLESHVSKRGKLIKKMHGFVNFPAKCIDVSLWTFGRQ